MHFQNFHSFLAMGGYASYVWPAYGIAFAVLFINFVIPLVKNKKNASRT